MFKKVPVCLLEAVLEFGECIVRPGCDSLCGEPDPASEGGVSWGKQEGEMV